MSKKIYRLNCDSHGEWRTTPMALDGYRTPTAEERAQLLCPQCGACGKYGKAITLKPGKKPCDDSCRFAKSDTCACTCGGEFHALRIAVRAS